MKPPWADRLDRIRQDKGLSYEGFGVPLRYSKAQMWKLINGKQPELTEEFIEALSHHYSVSREWLLEGKGDQYVSKETQRETSTVLRKPERNTDERLAALIWVAQGWDDSRLKIEISKAVNVGRTDVARALLEVMDQRGSSSLPDAVAVAALKVASESPNQPARSERLPEVGEPTEKTSGRGKSVGGDSVARLESQVQVLGEHEHES